LNGHTNNRQLYLSTFDETCCLIGRHITPEMLLRKWRKLFCLLLW